MLYKTITLELIQEHPQIHEQLRSSRTLLSTLDRMAIELKESHELWKERLAQASPAADPRQTAAEALELAIQDLQAVLRSVSSATTEPFPLDDAMNFVRQATPVA